MTIHPSPPFDRRLAHEKGLIVKSRLKIGWYVVDDGKRVLIVMGGVHFYLIIGSYPFEAPGFLFVGDQLLKEIVYKAALKKGLTEQECMKLMSAVDFPPGKWSPEMKVLDIYWKVKQVLDFLELDFGL